jgi:hypothetical protein
VLGIRAASLLTACAVLCSGCSALLAADPTPVPGAAATLTRSSRTPIPTTVRTAAASPSASPAPSRVAVGVGSATPVNHDVTDEEVAQIERRLEQALASPDLPGIEGLLLDHVSLSTSDGGQVMDAGQTAGWLRDHAGRGIQVTRIDRSTQAVMLEALTEGWPIQPPLDQGQVSFGLRRYDANGREDEDNGDWKVDVITAM